MDLAKMLRLLESGPKGLQEWNRQKTELPRGAGFNEELRKSDLRGMDLSGFDLREIDLSGTSLVGANLCGANLSGANLRGAKLMIADLSLANLTGAELNFADLSGADLAGATCDGVRLGKTKFVAVDVSPFCAALSSLRHDGESDVDHRSMAKSLHAENLRPFLKATGLPVSVVSYLLDSIESLPPAELLGMTQSAFISHAASDKPFGDRLNEALLGRGVSTLYFASDPPQKKRLRREARTRLDKHDRLLLVCTKASLLRSEVRHEIAATLEREMRDGVPYLFPLLVDSYAAREWQPADPDVRALVLDRAIDFQAAVESEVRFGNALELLLTGLAESRPASIPPRDNA